MEEAIKTFGKYATLGIIGLFFYFGVDILKNSTTNNAVMLFAGSGLIIGGIILGVISFADWHKREGYEHLLKQQTKIIEKLTNSINERARTDIEKEKNTRSNIALEGIGGEYKSKSEDGTNTN